MLIGHGVELGKLPTGDTHAIATDVTDVEAVSDEENNDAEYEISNQRGCNGSAIEDSECQGDVDEEADDNADREIDRFFRMYQGLEIQRAG
jgi:hypothetical protein